MLVIEKRNDTPLGFFADILKNEMQRKEGRNKNLTLPFHLTKLKSEPIFTKQKLKQLERIITFS